jgi:single-stranded DNA-binding protein
MNLCILTGNLGNDPEIFYSSDGDPIASFNLAFKSGKDKTSWIKVTAFKKTLGHEKRSTTEIYLHNLRNSERQAMDIFEHAR